MGKSAAEVGIARKSEDESERESDKGGEGQNITTTR